MPQIGKDFPQSKAARIAQLKEIKGGKAISTVKVPGHGTLPVYKIPLKCLTYNPYNTRFLAQAKTLQKRLGRELSSEKPEDIKKIEEFLWNYKKEANKSTINSLIREGQLTPGVVTIDGVILAGNRRFRLLNEIDRNPNEYSKDNASTDGLKYFEAAILDSVLDAKQIVRYESFYQYGMDDKVDYDPIQKYIAAHDQKEFFTTKEIATNFMAITNGDTKIVDKWLAVYDLMEEYLDYIEESEIFTALWGNEEAFLNLFETMKSLEKGRTKNESWDYDSMDITELKLRYFDYIRVGKSTHDFRLFKKIFLNQERWTNFNKQVQEVVDSANNETPSFDEYRKKYPDQTEDKISDIRNNDYKDKSPKKKKSNKKSIIKIKR